jgi:4-amino-4-deoxy-L-arabinose transferase-like glycosyltransferase
VTITRVKERTSRLLRRHWALIALEVIFIVTSLAYSTATGLWEGPDETGHFFFVRHVARTGGLPVQRFDQHNESHEGHQPPLYYVAGALLTFWIEMDDLPIMMRPNPNHLWKPGGHEPNIMLHTAAERFPYHGTALAMHIVRVLSIAFGAVTVWATYAIGREIYANQRAVPLAAAAFVALNPQFLFLSGVVNNDNAVIAFCALTMLLLVRLLRRGPSHRGFVLLGTFVGLALLSKQTAFSLGPLVAFVLLVMAYRERSLRQLLVWTGWVLLPVVLIAGWWYVRNQALYGDPLAYRLFAASRPGMHPTRFNSWPVIRDFLMRIQRSFWAMFGWMSVKVAPGIYNWLLGLYAIPVLGWLTGALWRAETGDPTSPETSRFRRCVIALFALAVVMAWLWVISFSSRVGGEGHQGRFLFIALPAIALAIAGGLAHLVPRRWEYLPLAAALVPLGVLAVRAPSAYIAPAYPVLTLPEDVLDEVRYPLDGLRFGDLADLAGYDVDFHGPTEAQLDLYWHVVGTTDKSYKVFVHLLNGGDELCSQHDGFPAEWRFATTHWRPGDVVLDPHPLSWEPNCCEDGCRVNAGFYLAESGERIVTPTGATWAEFAWPAASEEH